MQNKHLRWVRIYTELGNKMYIGTLRESDPTSSRVREREHG